MIRQLILTILFVIPVLSGNAQTIREIILPFNEGQCNAFEEDVMKTVDSAYDALAAGEKVRLILYTKIERRTRTHDELKTLTSKRYSLVNQYLNARKSFTTQQVKNLIPFDNTQELANRENTRVAYREFDVPIPGLQSFILLKSDDYYRSYNHLSDSCINHQRQEFEIDATEKNVIRTNGGLEITYTANSFVKENGAAHGCGTVRIVLEEYLTVAQMLSADLTTHSKGKMLESGGMFYMEAWCGNEKLKLKTGSYVDVLFPETEKKNDMRVFNGHKNENVSDWLLQSNGKVFLSPEETGNLFPEEVIQYEGIEGDYRGEEAFVKRTNSNDMADGYLLRTTQLGWINCDRFYDVEHKTDLLVNSDRKEEICYRIVFKDIKSIMPAYNYDATGLCKFENIPDGYNVTLVAFYVSLDRKTALFASKDIVLGETKKETLELKEISGGALEGILSDLFN